MELWTLMWLWVIQLGWRFLETASISLESIENVKSNIQGLKAMTNKLLLCLLQADCWAVGDFCQAVYTEDGTVYEAKIVSINTDDNTCVVRYLGYGNEEEQSLEDLIRHDRSNRKQRRSDSVSFSEVKYIYMYVCFFPCVNMYTGVCVCSFTKSVNVVDQE